MDQVISEAASKKVGRPRNDALARLGREVEPVVTRRHQQNLGYTVLAAEELMEDSRFEWLCSIKCAYEPKKYPWKMGILSELGRIPDTDTMKEIAAQLCGMEPKPKTKDAIAAIRDYRMGRP